MTLGAVTGTELVFSVTGEDEERAAVELERFCITHLGGGT
jgi:phosphotransferase system HPr-like phosphotransfer protein